MSAPQSRVAGGLKAALKNPNVSEEAKERAQERLDNMGELEDTNSRDQKLQGVDTAGKNTGNVLGGYKATLKNPNVSEEAKEHAEEVLRDNNAL